MLGADLTSPHSHIHILLQRCDEQEHTGPLPRMYARKSSAYAVREMAGKEMAGKRRWQLSPEDRGQRTETETEDEGRGGETPPAAAVDAGSSSSDEEGQVSAEVS